MFDVTPYVDCLWQVHPDMAAQVTRLESGGDLPQSTSIGTKK